MNNILWTDETWNPIAGCSVHTPGCTNCYAMQMAARLEAIALADMQRADTGKFDHYIGLTQPSKAGPVWSGQIGIAPDSTLTKPLRWKKPRRIFVNSMSDLFHPNVPDEVIDRVFAVMALCPQHSFQLLTKRSERMREYLTARNGMGNASLCKAINAIPRHLGNRHGALEMPLPNVWLGVSVEDQPRADQRIPDLLATPAAVRWISAEPLLGPVDLNELGLRSECRHENAYVEYDTNATVCRECEEEVLLDWVVCGGESGKNARPMHPDWARSLRDQCAAAGVPFFFKQWGEWIPLESEADWDHWGFDHRKHAHKVMHSAHLDANFFDVGKKRAGRLLDGVLHDGFPA